uniref:Uncharacterized protein n=1 Tax=Timema tahoe TaxID=61484 RepID=A0A7R9FFZ8_9NEOP|nr:unnamed protein product [Timema tahoe]
MEYRHDKPLQEFVAAHADVTTAGGKMDEGEIVNQLLVAMPQEIDSVVSAMDIMFSKDKSAVTVEYVKNTLLGLSEAERHKKTVSSSEDPHIWELQEKGYCVGFETGGVNVMYGFEHFIKRLEITMKWKLFF